MKGYQYNRKLVMMAGILFLLPTVYSMAAMAASVSKPTESSAIITIPVTIISQQNTCNVSFTGGTVSGSTYTFRDTLLKGQTQNNHLPFQAVVQCDEHAEVKTALTVRPAGSIKVNNNKVDLRPVGDLSVKSGELWLTHVNNQGGEEIIPMENSAGNTKPTAFCEGITSNTLQNICTLKPVTTILSTAPGGPVSTTLTFDVVYP
ncbi:hypothetical protein [Escherichia coli]|uniref:hypothetical protein n=1 Tax=Escherichia coli TaxID=562 RepID=UPI002101194C|nr:hypothetical protein [Escherichia coli]MCQ1639680.1 hypothetical protein [Escherichia coli]